MEFLATAGLVAGLLYAIRRLSIAKATLKRGFDDDASK
jgi:hypothetical protein